MCSEAPIQTKYVLHILVGSYVIILSKTENVLSTWASWKVMTRDLAL